MQESVPGGWTRIPDLDTLWRKVNEMKLRLFQEGVWERTFRSEQIDFQSLSPSSRQPLHLPLLFFLATLCLLALSYVTPSLYLFRFLGARESTPFFSALLSAPRTVAEQLGTVLSRGKVCF